MNYKHSAREIRENITLCDDISRECIMILYTDFNKTIMLKDINTP